MPGSGGEHEPSTPIHSRLNEPLLVGMGAISRWGRHLEGYPRAVSETPPDPGPFDTGLTPGDLDPERPEPIETPFGTFALFECEGEIVAVECWCPHMQGPLFEGTRRGNEVICPWHAWRFSLEDGSCRWAPAGAEQPDPLRILRALLGPTGTLLLHPPEG